MKTFYVPRTATPIGEDARIGRDADSPQTPPSKPLAEYREVRAYVLLGDPGAGKTREFRREADADDGGRYVPARNFLRGDIDDLSNISQETLLIDGLDEVRAGGTDLRVPLDGIVKRLRKLGRPRFRLSCRAAEWGLTDARAVATVAGVDPVPVLLLDPLGREGVRALLAQLLRDGPMDADDFIQQAGDHNLDGLLGNPQSLALLAGAVVGGRWPDTRSAVFEAACRELAKERNPQHLDGGQSVSVDLIMEAAGELSALALLTDASAICRHAAEAGAGDLSLSDIRQGGRAELVQALGTKLFSVQSPGRFGPVHRHVAEYLAARHLRDRVRGAGSAGRLGVPASRVLALVLAEDGGVATGLRGLAAWLATLCPEVRQPLIQAEPSGVFFYGDVAAVSAEDRASLVRTLEERPDQLKRLPAVPGALVQDTLAGWAGDLGTGGGAVPGSLVQHDTLALLVDMIGDDARGDGRQELVDLFLRGILRANPAPSGPMSVQQLLRVVRDETWRPTVRQDAARAAFHLANVPADMERIKALLHDVGEGLVPDQDNEIRGILLIRLYPDQISPAAVWDYLPKQANLRLLGAHLLFWSSKLAEQTEDRDIPTLLDGVASRDRELRAVLTQSSVARLVLRLEERIRHASGCTESRSTDVGEERLADRKSMSDEERLEDWKRSIERRNRPMSAGEKDLLEHWERSIEHRNREEEQYIAYVREHRESVAEASCQPGLLHELAKTYLGFASASQPRDPADVIGESLGGDDELVAAVLQGLSQVHQRDDVPSLNEVVELDEEGKMSLLTLPLLAGLAEMHRQGKDIAGTINDEVLKSALACHYLTTLPPVQDPHSGYYNSADTPDWYMEVAEPRRSLAAEAMIAACGSRIRRKESCNAHLSRLAGDERFREMARATVPGLLQAVPARCTQPQRAALFQLLSAAVRHLPEQLASWVGGKLARESMDMAQRALWLAAAMVVRPERYLTEATAFVAEGRRERVQRIVEFLSPDDLPSPPTAWLPAQLAEAVRLVGSRLQPRCSAQKELKVHLATPAEEATYKAGRLISQWLNRLASEPSNDAAFALESLAEEECLAGWRSTIVHARDRQLVVRRDATYRVPTLAEVQRVFRDEEAANAADLFALVVDRLQVLARGIHDGNTDDWRQYWNEGSHRRPTEPKHEDSCRDALLSDLRSALPEGVDAQPEGRYARSKRSDIRVACHGHAIPVEIKKNTHREMWSAINDQLIAQYVRDVNSGGFGVYLVLWFGDRRTKIVPPSGPLPETPDEMQIRLEQQVPPDKRHKIAVVVVDVSQPVGWDRDQP